MVLCACTFTSSGPTGSGAQLIKDRAGETLAKIFIGPEEVTVVLADRSLQGVAKRSDKRKYYDGSSMVYAVKMDEGGFKLRDENERLLWKVKLYPDKLKIANNEDMNGAYEVKLRDEGKLKLEKNERELNTIHLSVSSTPLAIAEKYSIEGFGISLAPGILMIDDLKDVEKFIIMAELVQRNR